MRSVSQVPISFRDTRPGDWPTACLLRTKPVRWSRPHKSVERGRIHATRSIDRTDDPVARRTGGRRHPAEARPDPRIKQLKILDQFAGSWTGTQPGTKRKVHVESEWILKGRVLQTKATLADGRELLVLRTYDPVLKTYIATIWDSNGLAVVVSGTGMRNTKR